MRLIARLKDSTHGYALFDVVPLAGASHSITNRSGAGLDDDLVTDLALPGRGTDSVRQLTSRGDGTFQAPEMLPTHPVAAK